MIDLNDDSITIWEVAAYNLSQMERETMLDRIREGAGTIDNKRIYEVALQKEYFEVCQGFKEVSPDSITSH